MSLPCAAPGVRLRRSASVHRGYAYLCGDRGLTSAGDRDGDRDGVGGFVLVVVNRCVSRTVAANVGPVGIEMRARVGVGVRVSVSLVCWW